MAYVIDQKNCTGCHRCRMDCPAEAIFFRNDKYWIDPEKCVDCGTCESVCHNNCISNPDIPAPKAAPHDTIKMECDVCVIGGGASGMVAAAKAQDMGAKVVILEKNKEIGGSGWYATGFGVHYSKFHEKAGKKDKREKIYKTFMEKTEGKADGALLQRLLEANCDFVNWMIDEHNFEELYELNPQGFQPMCLRKKVAPPWNDRRIDAMIGPGGGGWLIPTTLLEDFTAKGGILLCNTPAKELLVNEAGEITGVIAEDAGGKIEVSCKSAVVTTGAFTRNREIMAKMQPLFYDDTRQPVHIFTCSTCTGDGITMCEAIGADIDYENKRAVMMGPMRHPYPAVTLNSGNGPMFRATGERYRPLFAMTEISDMAYDAHRYVWKVTDDANFKSNVESKIGTGPDDNGVDLSHFLVNWRKVLEEEIESGSVVRGDTLEELAAKLGIDPVQFAADVAAYNEELKHPRPPMMMGGMDFGDKDDDDDGPSGPPMRMGPPAQPLANGPFYAIKMTMFHENSIGGMVIDKNAGVLKDGKPITGLFAGGDTTRGVMVSGEVGVRYVEGVFTALTYAFNSGYICGVEAAKHALR